jgi:hypothetical protein
MSKMTDRIDNQHIINLAREQYEQQQRKTLPSVIVHLASGGNIYPKNHILRTGQVEMRYMTAYDEDILTNSSYIKNGVVFDKLLESIITTQVNISEIAPDDKFGLIINARVLAYGPEYEIRVTDPKTGNEIDRVFDLRTLKLKPFNLIPDDLGEFEYKVNDQYVLKFKIPTENNIESGVSSFLKTIITQVNSSRSMSDIENFIRYEFLSADAKKFRKYISENNPGLDLIIDVEGEDGSTFKVGFPIGPQLFWF